MRKKKSTQQLVGIESVTDSSVLTAGGELTFYLVQPTNLNVLPESGVRTRVTALLNVLKTSAEMELLALDSKESYQDNRLYYRRRAEEEGNPAIRNCLKRVRKRDSALMMASQNLEDFDQEGVREMTKPLFAIPPHQFLFNPGSIDRRFYMDMLQLDEAEFELIRRARRGECLFKCGAERYHLKVIAPDHKAILFGTAGGK